MPFSLEKTVTDIINSDIVKTVFTHPIYTALVLVFIIMLTIYLVFQEEVDELEDNEFPFIGMLFRSGIYILLSTLGIIFIHNKSLQKEYEGAYENSVDRDTVNAGLSKKGGSDEDDIHKILTGAFKESKHDAKLNEPDDKNKINKKEDLEKSEKQKESEEQKEPIKAQKIIITTEKIEK